MDTTPTRPEPPPAHPLGRLLARLAAPALAPLPDGELLAHYRRGSEAAFALLVTRHGGMARAAALRVLGNADDADDAAQVAFALLAERAGALAGRPSVAGWLHGAARRVAMQLRRRQLRRARRERRAAKPEAVHPAGGAESAEDLAALDAALSRLPDYLREAVVLCELEGLPRQAAAERLGVPIGTLSSRLASAHRQLARRLGGPAAGAALAALLSPSSGASVPPPVVAGVWVAGVSPTAKLLLFEVKRMALFVKLKLVAAGVGVAIAAVGVTAGAGGRVGVGAAGPQETQAPAPPGGGAPAAPTLAADSVEARLIGVWEPVGVEVEPPLLIVAPGPVPKNLTLIERVTVESVGAGGEVRGETRFLVAGRGGVTNLRSARAGKLRVAAGPPARVSLDFFFPAGGSAGLSGSDVTASLRLDGDRLRLSIPFFAGETNPVPPKVVGATAPSAVEVYTYTFRREPRQEPAPPPKTAAPEAKPSPEAKALRTRDSLDRLKDSVVGLWRRTKLETANGRPLRQELTTIQ